MCYDFLYNNMCQQLSFFQNTTFPTEPYPTILPPHSLHTLTPKLACPAICRSNSLSPPSPSSCFLCLVNRPCGFSRKAHQCLLKLHVDLFNKGNRRMFVVCHIKQCQFMITKSLFVCLLLPIIYMQLCMDLEFRIICVNNASMEMVCHATPLPHPTTTTTALQEVARVTVAWVTE